MSVTIKDIAKLADVSITTVSRVVNNKSNGVGEETRQRIQKIMSDLNYHPNRVAIGLVTKKTNILGLVLPDITNPFFPEIVRGVEDTAALYGYNIILCNSDDNEKKERTYIQILKEKCVDGIIYTGVLSNSDKNLNVLYDYNIPFVMMDRSIDNTGVPVVYTDGETGMYNMIKYIISLGHKRIAYISGSRGSSPGDMRFKGYKKALNEENIDIDYSIIKEGNYKIKSGIECMTSLLNSGREFTAVACANDLMAVGALDALNSRKIRVPEEISISGYDNIYLSNVTCPKLTTVAQPTYEMGCESTKMLINLIEKKEIVEKKVILSSEIKIRESVTKRSEILGCSCYR